MISSFAPGLVPDLDRGKRYYDRDMSNYPSIRNAAMQLDKQCIDDDWPQYAGWRPVGRLGSIGVFLWGTMSPMNNIPGRAVNGVLDLPGANFTALQELNGTSLATE